MADNSIGEPISNLQEAQSAFLIGFIDELGLVRSVISYLDANPDLYEDSDLAEIASINQKRRDAVLQGPSLLRAYLARAVPDFDPKRDASERMARAFMKQLLEEFLRKPEEPCEACRHVVQINSIYDYPAWLGDLYEMCDWGGERLRREAEILAASL